MDKSRPNEYIEVLNNRSRRLVLPMLGGVIIAGLTNLSSIQDAKWLFQTQLFPGASVLDAMLIVGSIISVTSATAYTHCKYRRHYPNSEQTPAIHAAIAGTSGAAMAISYQFALVMTAYYGAKAGIDLSGLLAICAAATLGVSIICTVSKNYALYRDQTESYQREYTSFTAWMWKNGKTGDAIFFDCIVPTIFSATAVGVCGNLLKQAGSKSLPAIIALDTIVVSAMLIGLYSAFRAYRNAPAGSQEL
ncbi:MAG: hypothetical protein JSS50_04770 [Proteobacteria bacterium]|nr:hypothetical protein [Pseudomonadota bacterium]